MGARSNIVSYIVSALIMAAIWEITEMGAFRDITFVGRIFISLFVIVLAQIIGRILSGGK